MKHGILEGTVYPHREATSVRLVRAGLKIESPRFWVWASDPAALTRAVVRSAGSGTGGRHPQPGLVASVVRDLAADVAEAALLDPPDEGDGDDILDFDELVGAAFDAKKGVALLQFRADRLVGLEVSGNHLERIRDHFARRVPQLVHEEDITVPDPRTPTRILLGVLVVLSLTWAVLKLSF